MISSACRVSPRSAVPPRHTRMASGDPFLPFAFPQRSRSTFTMMPFKSGGVHSIDLQQYLLPTDAEIEHAVTL